MVGQTFHSDDESSSERAPQVVRVRIAPSPTGIPHIGNTRTALFNYIFAKHNNGRFILRIEDTDQARIVPGAKEAITEILEWLGLIPDETYIQSERLDVYKKASQILLERGFARKDEGAIRFLVPKGKTIEWEDKVGNKKISFKTRNIDDFVIVKSDGFPTYHLANIVDDHEMNISHVIRGDEWISSTPKHLLLYQAFGWAPPIFAHLPLILGPDKTKLSKRHGAQSALAYRDKGYLKEAIINFLMLLGWTHPQQKEVFSLDEVIKLFKLEDVNTNAPIFDIKKLEWLNGYYIRNLSINELKSKVKTSHLVPPKGGTSQDKRISNHISDELLDKLIPLAQTRMKTLNDFYELVAPFLEEIKVELKPGEKELAKKLLQNLESVKDWSKEEIREALKKFCADQGVNMKVIYIILTGKEQGLPLPETLKILGKENVIKHLSQ